MELKNDATTAAIVKMYDIDGYSVKAISRHLKISHGTVTKVLVSAGSLETKESKMFDAGMSRKEIAEKLEKSENAVNSRIPYVKGHYRSENPTANAMRIRKHREMKKEKC